MATDDERRRVARNIRDNYIRGGMWYRTASTYNIALAVGVVPDILVEDIVLWNRLADLIEPAPTSSDTTATHTDVTATRDTSQSRRDTVACDREALRSVATGLRSLGEREVLSAGAAREIGDEIMEAIGEVDES